MQMAGNGMQARACRDLPPGVGHDLLDDLHGRRCPPAIIDEPRFQFAEQRWPVAGRATEHDAVETPSELSFGRIAILNSAVQHELKIRALAFDPMDIIVFQRRYFPILLR